jgi:hypothetical protein
VVRKGAGLGFGIGFRTCGLGCESFVSLWGRAIGGRQIGNLSAQEDACRNATARVKLEAAAVPT